ncbi:MAG: 2-oxoacid:acceptor oxidoreductase family protein, partial [Chloroflexota bacterium]|nr:2-oxoacid:acceptor oxidoreductase family protein [Chloroflexota bacterium]
AYAVLTNHPQWWASFGVGALLIALAFPKMMILLRPINIHLTPTSFERHQGDIIVEKTGFTGDLERNDVKVVIIPAMETSLALGNIQASNLVMLGAYLATTNAIPAETVRKAIEAKFAGKGEKLALNMGAFEKGQSIAANQC